MKLKNAPVIVHRFDPDADWFQAAATEMRRRFADPPVDQSDFALMKLAEDIWGCTGSLELHVDKTRRGFEVFGLILVNEPRLQLVQDGDLWEIPPGTVFHIDGRRPHGAVKYGTQPDEGIFGFMAWDVHRHENVKDMLASIPDSMGAFARGETRVDVAMDNARTIEEMERANAGA